MSDPSERARIEDIEIRLLLEALHLRYHYDFRNYAMASIRRRLRQAREQLGFANFSAMQESVLHDPAMLPRVVIAHDGGQPLLRYSTDSPIRHISGSLEEMALYAGQGVGTIRDVVPAADRLRQIVDEARDCLAWPGPRP